MRIADIKFPDTANGPGVRVSLWLQGCSRRCKGCHNQSTWDASGGREMSKEDVNAIHNLLMLPWCDGLSILGGEPLDQHEELGEYLKIVKRNFPEKDIWLWTGSVYEDVSHLSLFDYVDTVVDGPYVESKRDIRLVFRGSSNQRIINLERH